MESTEPRRGFGTTVLVLLLALAFLVGTALFVYVGYQLLASGSGRQPALAEAPTLTPSPTVTLAPTATLRPTATRAPTHTPVPTAHPTAVSATDDDSLPQTGLGPIASLGTLMLAGIAVGARLLRRRR